jgi:putative protein-disulfide isomerase
MVNRILLGLLLLFVNWTTMSAQTPSYCDPATGLCTIEPVEAAALEEAFQEGVEIIYIGDPMCSWCWGISPHLNRLQREAAQRGIRYRIVVGGLRPGGGDPWNEQFRNFLQHHWEEVHARSGQPFGQELFELEHFDYDTEPACRAVVAARELAPELEVRFFELVQHYFYVQNQDPKEVDFYQPICATLGIDFQAFSDLFSSPETMAATQAEFQMNRQWGVTGYPTVVVRKDEKFLVVAQGYATFEQMWARVEAILQ